MSARQHQAVAFFIQQGWTPEQSAGLVANLQAESAMRHDAVGDGGAAYGIAQWHADRQSGFAATMGRPIQGSSFEAQLYFVHAELRGTEKRAGDALAACTTAAEAGACVSKLYERPADREGEATKRAALAERIFQAYDAAAQDGAGEPIPPPLAPAPIPPEIAAPRPGMGQIPSLPEKSMPALLMALLPTVLSLFAPRVQQQVAKVTGQPPDVAGAFVADLFAKIAGATNTPADNPVAGVAALQTAPPAVVQAVESHALDYLDKIAPMLGKLAEQDRVTNETLLIGRNAALERALRDPYDVAPVMVANVTQTSNWLLAGLVFAVLAAIGLKAWFPALPDYVPMILPALMLLAGQISKERGAIISYRFDGTPSTNAANAINAEIVAQRPKL